MAQSMAMTSEIRKGDFVYRDTFFADPGNDKRHPRASVTELKDLLLPKKGHIPPKDQVAHWYEAQLLHYGLARTKDKNGAKVRLTAAIAAGSLTVPAHIVQLESEMKKEFAAASRKAKAAAKKLSTAKSSLETPGPKSKKRKAESLNDDVQPAATLRTKISVTVGNVTLDVDHHDGAIDDAKKRKIASSKPAKVTTTKSATTKAEKEKGKKSIIPSKHLELPSNSSKPPKKRSVTTASQPAKKAAATPKAKQSSRTGSEVVSSSVTRPAKKQTAKKVKHETDVPSSTTSDSYPTVHDRIHSGIHDHYKREDDVKMEEDVDMEDAPPPPYDSLTFNHEHSDSSRTTSLQVSGTYAISTVFDNMDCELTLVKDPRTGHFWAHFLAADNEGVLHIPNTEGMAKQQPVEFYWRAEELGPGGRLRFKRDQDGWIQLDGQGGVRGCWNGLLGGDDGDDLEFEGRMEGPPDFVVGALVGRWEWFVKSAYGR